MTVLTLSGSAAATVGVVDPGCYSVMPSSPASVTGGTGTLATLTLTATAASGAYTVQPGQSCPLWAGVIPLWIDSVDLGDWTASSTAASQNGTILYF